MAHKLPPLRFGYAALEPYLKYRNRRPDYLSAWWNVIAWDVIDERLRDVMAETGGTLCRDTSRPSS